MINPTQVLLRLIRRYQAEGGGRAHFAVECNFEPSCSEFTCQALELHGLRKGLRLAFARLRRCNHPDALVKAFDPVPE